MADDNDDWFGGGDDKEPTPPPVVKKLGKKGDAKKAEAAPPPEEVKPVEEAPQPQPEVAQEETEFLDPDRLLLCKHWIRPRFLQYKYLYDYRHNYYDDVIDYIDKRNRGLRSEIPRPQTWAERTLRTFSSNQYKSEYLKKMEEDQKLATKMKLTGAFYHYHTKEYFNRRYSRIL